MLLFKSSCNNKKIQQNQFLSSFSLRIIIMTHANGHFGSLTEKARLVTKAGGLYFPQVKLRKPWTLVVKTI